MHRALCVPVWFPNILFCFVLIAKHCQHRFVWPGGERERESEIDKESERERVALTVLLVGPVQVHGK